MIIKRLFDAGSILLSIFFFILIFSSSSWARVTVAPGYSPGSLEFQEAPGVTFGDDFEDYTYEDDWLGISFAYGTISQENGVLITQAFGAEDTKVGPDTVLITKQEFDPQTFSAQIKARIDPDFTSGISLISFSFGIFFDGIKGVRLECTINTEASLSYCGVSIPEVPPEYEQVEYILGKDLILKFVYDHTNGTVSVLIEDLGGTIYSQSNIPFTMVDRFRFGILAHVYTPAPSSLYVVWDDFTSTLFIPDQYVASMTPLAIEEVAVYDVVPTGVDTLTGTAFIIPPHFIPVLSDDTPISAADGETNINAGLVSIYGIHFTIYTTLCLSEFEAMILGQGGDVDIFIEDIFLAKGYGEDYEWNIPNTWTGTKIEVSLDGVTVTFSEVTAEGRTTLAISEVGPEPPEGYNLIILYFDITTTADLPEDYTVVVCVDAVSYGLTLTPDDELMKAKFDPKTGEWIWKGVTDTIINNVICSEQMDSLTIYAIMRPAIIPATIDIDPNTLNLKSKGKWITAYIELPEDYDVNDIDIGTVLLNDIVSAEMHPTEVGDYDEDGIPDLIVKYDRAAVQNILEPEDQVEIVVTGEVAGMTFEGKDTIRVIDNGS